jgi:hypothetical protein
VPPDDWYVPADYRHTWWSVLTSASRACCCPAQPAVMVLMPAPGRPHHTDLLLCRHHYRVSRKALTAAGAIVLDPDDVPEGRQPQGRAIVSVTGICSDGISGAPHPVFRPVPAAFVCHPWRSYLAAAL